MFTTATRVRIGDLLEIDGDPCKVLDRTHITPGKGNAVVQAKLRNLRTGIQFELRFRSTENVKTAEIDEFQMEYLYSEGSFYHFMNSENFEQIAVPEEVLGEVADWLVENLKIKIQYYNEKIVGATLPKSLDLRVVETTPYMRGSTATNQPKPAKLENGVTINVPPFIENGELVRVDPEKREYLERVKA